MIYISGIFFFFGIGIFGLLNIRNDDQIMEWGYWHVFSLNIAHADDDEDEEDEWKWNSKQEKNENEKNEHQPDPVPKTINAIPITKKVSPITIKAATPVPQEQTIMLSLIEPYKPLNGYTYVIYRLPDASYIIQDPDGRFIDHKYTSIDTAKRSIDEDGVFNPLIAYTTPNGQTFTILENIASHAFAYRTDNGKTIQTTHMNKSDIIADLLSENPYNPNAPYDIALENTISSNDIAYAQAIALGESEIQQIVSSQSGHAISIERPIVPADYEINIQGLTEKKLITDNTVTVPTSTRPVINTTQTQITKPITRSPAPVVAQPKPVSVSTAPKPTPVVTQPRVNTTTRAS